MLGYHVLQRSRPARLGLSVLALPLFFGGLATGGFLTSLVVAATVLLWLGPSRAWFDGTPLPGAGPPRLAREQQRPGLAVGAARSPTPPRSDLPPPHTRDLRRAPRRPWSRAWRRSPLGARAPPGRAWSGRAS